MLFISSKSRLFNGGKFAFFSTCRPHNFGGSFSALSIVFQSSSWHITHTLSFFYYSYYTIFFSVCQVNILWTSQYFNFLLVLFLVPLTVYIIPHFPAYVNTFFVSSTYCTKTFFFFVQIAIIIKLLQNPIKSIIKYYQFMNNYQKIPYR